MTIDLLTAADTNLAIHATWVPERLAGGRVRVHDDLVLADSGLPCDTFNFICRARLESGSAAKRVGEALRFFAESGNPFSWWLGPGFTPANLPAVLKVAGLNEAETELAMAVELAKLPELPAIPALEIRRITTPVDLDALATLSAANWNPPDRHVVSFYRQAAPFLLRGDSPQWFYLGLMEGAPVATTELTVGGGVVGLYNISTRPEFRGRGIGSAMTQAPLLAARQAGHKVGILQASGAGVGVYKRMGFEEFGTVTEYKP